MQRILVIGPSWVGDMVMAQSLFLLLRQQHPHCRLSVLAPAWSEPVTARMPEVDESIAMPVGHGRLGLAERWRLGRSLRGRFDRAIVLPGSFKSALVPWFAGVPVRTGYTGEQRYGLLNDRRELDRRSMPLHLQRVAALAMPPDAPVPALGEIPWPRLDIDDESRRATAARFGIDPGTRLVALCPGAEFGPSKQWPAGYFAGVANDQVARGARVAIFGSANDATVAGGIRELAPAAIDLTGQTTLGEAIDLMSLAAAVVSNDSGLMHVAAAVGAPLVAIYGSSSDAYTPPLQTGARRLARQMDCRPCFQRECPLGHTDCLKGISVEQVNTALAELFGGGATTDSRPGTGREHPVS